MQGRLERPGRHAGVGVDPAPTGLVDAGQGLHETGFVHSDDLVELGRTGLYEPESAIEVRRFERCGDRCETFGALGVPRTCLVSRETLVGHDCHGHSATVTQYRSGERLEAVGHDEYDDLSLPPVARLELFRTNGNRFRIGPWRGDPSTGFLMPLDIARRLSSSSIESAVDTLARQGFSSVVTSALTPQECTAFTSASFVTAQELHLLVHPLSQIPPPSRTYPALRRGRRRDRQRMLEVDALAFDDFWRFDDSSLVEAIRATPRSRIRVAATKPVCAYAVTGAGSNTAYLQRLAVHPDSQGAGLGTELVNDALRWARKRGAERCFVNTQLDNTRARDLYERLGFVTEPDRLRVLQRNLAV